MIIGVSGKSGSGKDLFAEIFTELKAVREDKVHEEWIVKKFAYKVKEVLCILLGCTMEQLEDPEFKKQRLPKQWDIYAPYGNPTNGLYIEEEKDPEVVDILKSVDYTYRTAMTTVGTDLLRDGFHPNVWVNALMNDYFCGNCGWNSKQCGKISDCSGYALPNWLITDVRFENEAAAVRKKDGWLIRIDRPNFDNGLTDIQKQHQSETDLDDYKLFQYHIVNDGNIDHFVDEVRKFLVHYNTIRGITPTFVG